jgi:hypothetical protein
MPTAVWRVHARDWQRVSLGDGGGGTRPRASILMRAEVAVKMKDFALCDHSRCAASYIAISSNSPVVVCKANLLPADPVAVTVQELGA